MENYQESALLEAPLCDAVALRLSCGNIVETAFSTRWTSTGI